MTKTQLVNAIQSKMGEGITKTNVKAFLESLTAVCGETLKKEGVITLPNIVKLVVAKVPAKPERKARNPRTGEEMTVPAKPAGKKLKARFVKHLKVAVGQLPAPKKEKAESAPAKATTKAAPTKKSNKREEAQA